MIMYSPEVKSRCNWVVIFLGSDCMWKIQNNQSGCNTQHFFHHIKLNTLYLAWKYRNVNENEVTICSIYIFPDFLHVFIYIQPRSFAPSAIWFTLAIPYTYIWIMVRKYYTEPLNILQCLYNNFTTWAIHLYENIYLIRLNVWRRGLTITFSLLVVPEVVRCRKKIEYLHVSVCAFLL